MNVYDGIHWNIYDIIPYQRNFNFINSERSLGKTYTTEMYIIDKCINNNQEFIYICRNQNEKDSGILEDAFKKVIKNEFNNILFRWTQETVEYTTDEKENKWKLLGYCISLSSVYKIKRKSYPKVKYMLFDEYTLEDNPSIKYINGWKEPDLLLNLYHTVDREEDRVICFLLGNNTKFHNPYHLHPAFHIPITQKGKIWTSENVLFQNATSNLKFKQIKSKSKFIRMIENTEYGAYAVHGDYIYDNNSFIKSRPGDTFYWFTIENDSYKYGVWMSRKEGLIYVDNKIDPSCKLIYAVTLSDHKENTILLNGKTNQLKTFANYYKAGIVRFTSMPLKAKLEKALYSIL